MKEVKSPKKPLIYYYGIALLVLVLVNFLALPMIAKQQIKEVDYGTFMSMTEKQEIGQVEIQENQILFTDKAGENIYKTGLMNDPDLTQRLYDSGAKFTKEGRITRSLCCGRCRAVLTSFVHGGTMYIIILSLANAEEERK